MRDGTPFEPGTGRVPSPDDPQDHSIRRYVPQIRAVAARVPITKVPWTPTLPLLNQGNTPQCVAYSAALASTIDQRRDHRRTVWYDAPEAYARCKEADGIPHIGGTYPRVMLKIKQARGMRVERSPRKPSEVGEFDQIGAYAALRTMEEVVASIHLFGSVILGSVWYDEWFDVPADRVLPRGHRDAGGHAYTAIGWNLATRRLLIQNSWGEWWGYKIGGLAGRAWLPMEFVDLSNQHDWEAWRSVDIQDQ